MTTGPARGALPRLHEPLAALLRPELAELQAYVPRPGRFEVRLDANESPAQLSAEARAVVARALAQGIRITVGLPAENDRLLAELAACA